MYMCANDIYAILQKLEGGGGGDHKKEEEFSGGGGGGGDTPCLHQQYICPARVVNVMLFVLVLCVMSAVLNRCDPSGQGKKWENARMFEGRIHGPYNNTRPRLTGQCCRR